MNKHRDEGTRGRTRHSSLFTLHFSLFTLLVASPLSSPTAAAGADLNPPKPNPADPVDYVKWIDHTFGKDIDDNANDIYLTAYERAKPFAGDWGDTLDKPWSNNKRVADWLDAHGEALELFRKAAKHPRFYLKMTLGEPAGDARVDGAAMLMLLPELTLHRDLAKGLIAQGYRAWESGDHTLLARNALVALRSGRQLCTSPVLIVYLVGVSISAPAYEAAAVALRMSDAPMELAIGLVDELTAFDPPFPPLTTLMTIERAVVWDICQRLYVPGEEKGTWTLHEPMMQVFSGGIRRPITESEQEEIARIGFDKAVAEVNAYFDGMLTWVKTPYHRIAPADRAKFRQEKFEHILAETKNPLVELVLASYVNMRKFHEQITALRRATHLTFHLFARHDKYGSFPRSLAALKVPDLAQLRVDPFSGKDFVYKRGRSGFKLYSVSHNGTDDEGKHAPWNEDGDYIIWPPQPVQK